MKISDSGIEKIFKGISILFIILIIWLVYIALHSSSVLRPIAVAINMPFLCEKITVSSLMGMGPSASDYRVGCYSNIATTHHDVSACNYIPTTADSSNKIKTMFDARASCYARVAASVVDPSTCNNTNNFAKDACYLFYQNLVRDIAVCKSVENIELRTFCYEYFRTDAGDTCYGIIDENEKLRCFVQDACTAHQC